MSETSAPAPTSAETLLDEQGEIVAYLRRDVVGRRQLASINVSGGAPPEFHAGIADQHERWANVVEALFAEVERLRSLVEQARGSGVAILDGEDVKMLRAASLHFLDVYLHNGSLVAQYRAARADRLIALAARGSIAAPVQAPPTTDEIAQVIYASDVWPESSTWEHASTLNRTRCLEAAAKIRAALIARPSEGDND